MVRTYAPCGETPILKAVLSREHLSVMSGVTIEGGLFTLVRENALTSQESAIFLRHVYHQTGRKVLAVWDGSPIHRGQIVKDFLADGGAKFVSVEQFPAYAPELNPDEGVWQHLKHVEMRNLCCVDLPDLSHQLHLAVRRLRCKPETIKSFFAGAGLPI